MKKVTSRDIHAFIGGALAFSGFYGLFWLPYYIFSAPEMGQMISHLVTALLLPLGIGMLMGATWAMTLAKIYLWVVVVSGCIAIPVVCLALSSRTAHSILRYNVDFLASIALLWLMVWSGSKKFGGEPGG